MRFLSRLLSLPLAVLLVAGLLGGVMLAAPEEPAEVPAEPAVAPQSSEVGVLEYRRGSFRDPFRSLAKKGDPDRGPRPPGPAGMLIEEIDLVGVLSGPKGSMILIIGSDGLGYSLTEGAPLYDGRVLRIQESEGAVVFRQDVNDPNRIKPYRDIERKIETAS